MSEHTTTAIDEGIELYLSRERIAELREEALQGKPEQLMGIKRSELVELICDWKNLQPSFEELPPPTDRVSRLRHLSSRDRNQEEYQ